MIRLRHTLLYLLAVVLFEPIICVPSMGTVHAQKQKPSMIPELRKDPFSLPPGIRPLSQETPVPHEKKKQQFVDELKPIETKPEEIPVKLKAVLITDHIRLASIDRFIVTIGDLIHGEKVKEIHPDRVVLEKEGKKRILLLDQTSVKIKVEER